jgi:hypothetical protein
MGEAQLGAELTDKEEDDIVAFLGTLIGQLPKAGLRSIATIGTTGSVEYALITKTLHIHVDRR